MNFSKASFIFISWLGVSSVAGVGVYFSSLYDPLVKQFDGKIVFSKIVFQDIKTSETSASKDFYMARLLTNEEYNKEEPFVSKVSDRSAETTTKKQVDNSLSFDISYPINKEKAWEVLIDIEFKTFEEVKTILKTKLEDLKKNFSAKTVKEIKEKFSLS